MPPPDPRSLVDEDPRLAPSATRVDALVSALATLAEENAALRARLEEAERLAELDPLTGVANRRGFLRALHRTLSFVERYRLPAAVVYIDLDGFKAINDGYGHAVGDAALRHVARTLRANVRDSDQVGRVGGDEFGVILTLAAPDDAARKADALADEIEAAPFAYAGVTHPLRASAGVRLLEPADDPESALAWADEAMFAVKHARRRQPDRDADATAA